jgi:geranylgeranyl pyrophosphate synthase
MLNLVMAPDKLRAETRVYEILNNHLQIPGKLFRPNLTVKLGQFLKLAEEDCKHICWASELIHNASLIHDDVVDSAYMRRDKPTLNSFMSNSKAVLAGDYLLASVIAELVRLKQYEILKTLAETLEEIVAGEFEQDSLKQKAQVNWTDLEAVALKKTGALIAWNCHSVAYCSGLSIESQNICQQLGLKLGLAFQMIDDNLDYSRNSGKEYAKDLKEGLINFTTLNLIQLYPELYNGIYQIRGSNFETHPWTEPQIEDAKLKTVEKSGQLFEEIFQLLHQLAEKENLSHTNDDYQDLLNFLKDVQDRQR